jgi:hypothetical protein
VGWLRAVLHSKKPPFDAGPFSNPDPVTPIGPLGAIFALGFTVMVGPEADADAAEPSMTPPTVRAARPIAPNRFANTLTRLMPAFFRC